jgi:hypothetical protein
MLVVLNVARRFQWRFEKSSDHARRFASAHSPFSESLIHQRTIHGALVVDASGSNTCASCRSRALKAMHNTRIIIKYIYVVTSNESSASYLTTCL